MNRTTLAALAALVLTVACNDATSTSTVSDQASAKPGPVDPTATWLIPLADAGLGFRSDGLYAQGGNSVYADGTCGVSASIFATTARSNSGDATIQTDKGARNCQRRFTLLNPDGSTQTVPSFNNLNKLENSTYAIPVGDSGLRRLIIGPGTAPCGRIILGDNGSVGAGSDMLMVARLSAGSWDVHSQTTGANLALCENTGQFYAFPVHFVITTP